MIATYQCLLLSRQWRDGPGRVEITLWGLAEEGPIKVVAGADAVMFVRRRTPEAATRGARRAQVELRTLQGEPVDALYFKQQRSLTDARDALRAGMHTALESDVKPSDRYVMERFITGSFEVTGEASERRGEGAGVRVVRAGKVRSIPAPPNAAESMRVTSLDIETDGPNGALLSFALVTRGAGGDAIEEVHLVGEGRVSAQIEGTEARPELAKDERALLQRLLARIAALDPDVLIGWNVVDFDLAHLERRAGIHRVPFTLGRGREYARVLLGDRGQVPIARVPGRVVLDGIATLKNATWSFERYGLDHVARELLGRGKLVTARAAADKIEEIRRMAREDPCALAAYNLEDARLVADIFEAADLLRFACARADLVGLPMDRQGGSVAAFDHLYLPRLHRLGHVAPDVGVEVEAVTSPGGEVLASVPGLHEHVLAFDFRSLYPSIIRTFKIDPLGMHLAIRGEGAEASEPRMGEDIKVTKATLPGFDGARFTHEPSILPELIERLTVARADAMARKAEALSRAIKIQMNSFYGVLGTPGCRFFDPRLPTSITRRGHQIIHRAKKFFEDEGFTVLYGDTDSLFVHAAGWLERGGDPSDAGAQLRALGADLARRANELLASEIGAEHGVESALELRFDAHFRSFLMPTVRGSEVGSKKRYAGAIERAGEGGAPRVEVLVRGLEAVRTDWTPFARRVQRELLGRIFMGEPWQDWLRETRAGLFHGAYDDELVYRKRLRRDLDDYGAAPPHVKAARLAGDGREDVEYFMAIRGPLPIDHRGQGDAIDYQHYLQKQLAPVCDVVLHVLGTSFARVAGTQLNLF